MKTSVQARLDPESQAALDRLVRRLGWSTSEVVREGIRLVDKRQHSEVAPRRMIGIGMFDSGIPDLGSNKKHLEGFGSNSGIGRKPGAKLKRKAG
jgi:Arc/MetJ-type ribon-helix-helix transcriptional regulator